MTIKTFFKTPKGLLTIILVVLTTMASSVAGLRLVAPGLAAAIGTAMMIDAPILRLRGGEWSFPSGAFLTGLIVGTILSPQEPWYVPAVTSAVAIVSKHVIRVRTTNVFNPAALALVATYYLFDSEQSWWGALPDLPPFALLVLIVTGVYITDRVNKMTGALAFLGTYYSILTVASFVGDPGHVAGLFRAPDLSAALYFAFFMVTDPPTSPAKPRDQVSYGIIVGVVSCAVFESIGAAWFLLAGLLVANAWDGARRMVAGKRNAQRRAAAASHSPLDARA